MPSRMSKVISGVENGRNKMDHKKFDKEAVTACNEMYQELKKQLPTGNWFKFTLPGEILRTMNKAQYKAAMSWLRRARRIVQEEMNKSVMIIPDELRGDIC